MLIAVASDVSETLRNLVGEMGVDLDDKGTKMFDHFKTPDAADHTLLASYSMPDLPLLRGSPVVSAVTAVVHRLGCLLLGNLTSCR